MTQPTPEQVATWREDAAYIYLDDDNVQCEDIELEHHIAGYVRAMTEQSEELEPLKSDIEHALYALTESETDNDKLKAEIERLKGELETVKYHYKQWIKHGSAA